MSIIFFLIIFLVWAIGTIKTESQNIDRYHALGDKENERRSAEHGATAIIYLGLFVILVIVTLISMAG